MVWTVTLIVNDCNTSDPLPNVYVNLDALTNLGWTDANGQFIFFADDIYNAVLVKLVHDAATPTAAHGYIQRTHSFNKANNGKTETVCLNPAPPREVTDTDGPGDCFIVTATTGSAMSDEVLALRTTRDRVAGRSRLAGLLIDRIYAEYASFSPPIAARLQEDPVARMRVLDNAVRPLFTWYQLAAQLALNHRDKATIKDTVAAYVEARSRADNLSELLFTLPSAQEAASAGTGSADLLSAAAVAELRFVRWAILHPLLAIASRADDPVHLIAEWLSLAPIDRLEHPETNDLQSLAAFFDFDPEARCRLGARLLEAWPNLNSGLADAGFLAPLHIV